VLLTNDRVSAVIAAAPVPLGYRRQLGALVDLVPAGAETDSLQVLVPAVRIGADTVRIDALSVRPTGAGVEVAGRLPGHPFLDVTTTFSLPDQTPVVHIVTRVHNRGLEPVVVGVEDEVYLGNVRYFAPGVGDVDAPATIEAAWFGHSRDDLAFGYAAGVPGPLSLSLKATTIGDSVFYGSARPFLGLAEVASGRSVSWRRRVAAGRGDVSAVSDILLRADDSGAREITGRVRTADGSSPPPRTRVEILGADGAPFTRARVGDDGSFGVLAPPGPASLVAHAPGLPPSEAVEAAAGGPARAELTLPAAGRLRFAVREARRGPLPARVVIRGISPTPDPWFGPVTRAEGALHSVYSHDGSGSVPLGVGRYRVYATHGLEYDVARAEVRIEQGAEARVDLTIRRVVETSGAISADLHLHAAGSGDSDVSFAARVRSLVAEGIELAVATDHNRVSDYGPAVEALGLADRIRVVAGSEVSTTGSDRWGHFNAFPLRRDPGRPGSGSPPYDSVSPTALFRSIREHPGEQVIQVNHPRMPPRIGYFDHVRLDTGTGRAARAEWDAGFDAIEVFNGIWLGHPARVERNLADWFALLSAGHRFAATGNSDSHTLVLQEVGYPRTYIYVEDDDVARLSVDAAVEAIRRGRTQVTSGPFLRVALAGQGPGRTVRAAGRKTLPLEVWVHAAPPIPVDRVEVVVGGKTLWAIPIPPATSALRFHGRFDLSVSRSTWVVVVARGGPWSGPVSPVEDAVVWAFTSPVFVDRTPASRVDSPDGVP